MCVSFRLHNELRPSWGVPSNMMIVAQLLKNFSALLKHEMSLPCPQHTFANSVKVQSLMEQFVSI